MYDKAGEEHYNIISALHKSMRNSDADAAVYWLARMLEGGEDPMYIARRMVRAASEDIGNADPQALVLAIAARQATHLSVCPKPTSRSRRRDLSGHCAEEQRRLHGYGAASMKRRATPRTVPLHMRNAPTGLMKHLGYGRGYHTRTTSPTAAMDCLPPSLQGRRYYTPKQRGYEKEIARRLERWEEIKQQRRTTDVLADRPDSPAGDDRGE